MTRIILFNLFITFIFTSCERVYKEELNTVDCKYDSLTQVIDSLEEKITNYQTLELKSKYTEEILTKSNQTIISKESGNKKYCYIDSIFKLNDDVFITVDYIQYIDDSNPNFDVEKGELSGYYVVNENAKLRNFIVDENTKFSVYTGRGSIILDDDFNLNELIKLRDYKFSIWLIDVKDGLVLSFSEVYQP